MKKKNFHIRIWHASCLRKRRNEKRKAKNGRIKKNRRKKRKQRKSKDISNFYTENSKTLLAPACFSLLEYSEKVIDFINEIDKSIKNSQIKELKFDLCNIVNIDIGAISVLLSKLNELSAKRITYWGTFPKDNRCRKDFEESGFLDRMRDMSSGKKFHRKNKNLIVNRGSDKTDNAQTAKEIRKAIEHLTNETNNYPPIYSIIQEICANSIEHANEQTNKKNWLFATRYLENEVIFTMADIGDGILKTIKRKLSKQITESLDSPIEILTNAFNKKYESKTRDPNRNKGLPKIYEIAEKKYIKNLIIITNNVIWDFDNPEKSKVIKKNFDGTFYFWILDKKCIDTWKKRLARSQ